MHRTRYAGRHRAPEKKIITELRAVSSTWTRRILVPVSAVMAIVLGLGSTAFAVPVRVKSGDSFSGLVAKHCGTSNWQSVAFPGRDKNKIYAGEVIDITCARSTPARAAASAAPASAPVAKSNKAAIAVNFAMAQIGKPYRWGAAGPNSYDCSGLVMASYARVGVRLPHYTGTMINYGVRVSRANLRIGDVVWMSSHHVGLYIGNNKVVVAPHAGDRVKVQTIYAFYAARRMIS